MKSVTYILLLLMISIFANEKLYSQDIHYDQLEKPLKRSTALETIKLGISYKEVLKKFGAPGKGSINDFKNIVLLYTYYPIETKPTQSDGSIPSGCVLIFTDNKLTKWFEDYYRMNR